MQRKTAGVRRKTRPRECWLGCVARYGRHGETRGDTGRYGEIRGEIPLLGAGVLAVKDVEASDLRHAAVQLRVDETVREPVVVCKFDGTAQRRIRTLAHCWACIISSTISHTPS